jgi:hypothetical protein
MEYKPNSLEKMQEPFRKQYQGRYQPAQIKSPPSSDLQALGLEPKGFYEISISGTNQQADQPAHYQSYAHPEQGIIVIVRAYRDQDKTAQGANPPHFSEMLFEQWVQVLESQKKSELVLLRQVYIYHVAEKHLIDALILLHMGEGQTLQCAPTSAAFKQISQTPFGKAIEHCLKDHFPKVSVQSLEVRTRKPAISGLQPPFDVCFQLAEMKSM